MSAYKPARNHPWRRRMNLEAGMADAKRKARAECFDAAQQNPASHGSETAGATLHASKTGSEAKHATQADKPRDRQAGQS